MATGPDLSIELTKHFAEAATPLFADFRLTVAGGTVLAIVGPSGIGKSSLLRMIAGIDKDFIGSIRIGDVAASDAPAPGMVFQDARLLPWLTVRDNLTALIPGLSLATADARLAQVGLAAESALYPFQLSGGMQRRVALARALAANPRLLLLDEPFVSLEPLLAGEMRGLVQRLIDESGATVVLVTHAAEDAAALAHRVLVLGGRPARIVADLDLATPPATRTAADRAAIAAAIADRLARGAGENAD